MGKVMNTMTGIVAIVGIAPWCVFLGGLGHLTSKLDDLDVDDLIKQNQIMVEWYIVMSQFIYLLAIAIIAFAGLLRRSHSVIVMFLAVNTGLLIWRATYRLDMINGIDSLQDYNDYLDALEDPLPTLRAIAAGQVMTAGVNFLLAVLAGLAGTDVDAPSYGQPQPATAA